MKKFNYKYVLALALILLATLLLCSCGDSFEKQLEKMTEEERGLAIAEKGFYNQDQASSYQTSTEMTIDLAYNDTDIYVTQFGKEIIYGADTEDYYHYQKMIITADNTSKILVSGYANGKMFESDGAHYVYSTLSKEDYLSYLEKVNELKDTSHLADPTHISAQKDEDGCWTIEVRGFDEESIKFICDEIFDGINTLYEYTFEVSDVVMSLNLSPDYYVEDFSIMLEHTPLTSVGNPRNPVIEFKASFSDYNSVKENELEEIEFSKYTDVSNLSLLGLAKSKVESIIKRDYASFNSAISTSASQNGLTRTFSYIYAGAFENTADGLIYQMTTSSDSILGSETVTTKYGNNIYTESSGSNSSSKQMSNYEAKSVLSSIIMPLPFSIGGLSSCDVAETDTSSTYTFTYSEIDPNILGGVAVTQRATLTVIVKNGEVSSFSYRASGTTSSNQTIVISITNTFA